MALSQNMIIWVSERVAEAKAILSNPRSTPSQRTIAKLVLEQWDLPHLYADLEDALETISNIDEAIFDASAPVSRSIYI